MISDVAVQTISNIYHNFPNQHTLLITHSNQALNQLFEKIVALDINPKHLLRLGHGEEELEIQGTGGDWGKTGRVNSFLERRIALLANVDRMAGVLGVDGAHGNSCETAGYFYTCHVLPKIEVFKAGVDGFKNVQDVIGAFGLAEFFDDAPSPVFSDGVDLDGAVESAIGCCKWIEDMYAELDELRAFELLRGSKDRSNYLLVKEAKIIALTCTHAALKRRELVKLGFKVCLVWANMVVR
jgi:intron-binding protein aquarius